MSATDFLWHVGADVVGSALAIAFFLLIGRPRPSVSRLDVRHLAADRVPRTRHARTAIPVVDRSDGWTDRK